MKFKLNRAFRAASGELDGLIYRNIRGNVVASRKPDMSNVVYSEDQLAHRERFKQAAAFGKSVMADSSLRALYEEIAKSKNIPLFAATIADFFNEPVINDIDLAAYNGAAGDVIKIRAMDDFGVANVYVTLTNFQGGAPIENGQAVETAPGSGVWQYTAQTVVNAGTAVNIQVAATDRPGGTAVETRTKTV